MKGGKLKEHLDAVANRAIVHERWHQRFKHVSNLPNIEIIPRGKMSEWM